MTVKRDFVENSEAVVAHLGIAQSVIQRMASNCTACKAWCITLVSAILVVVADKGKPQFTVIAFIPTLLFFALDAYYLALEKMFRASYNAFITKLHVGKIDHLDLYAISPSGSFPKALMMSCISLSIWPFYFTLLLITWIARGL